MRAKPCPRCGGDVDVTYARQGTVDERDYPPHYRRFDACRDCGWRHTGVMSSAEIARVFPGDVEVIG